MDRNNVSSETAAEQLINREVFEKEDWTVEAQASAGEGLKNRKNRIDYRVDTPEGLSFGIEVKRDLVMGYMTMRQMAECFEQTAAYTRALDLPVFLGPVITTGTPSETYAGGTSCTALAAYNILGGRINVGTLVFFNHKYTPWKAPFWGMILRGDFFWTSDRNIRERRNFQNGFNPKKTTMVTSSGSKNIRKSLLEAEN